MDNLSNIGTIKKIFEKHGFTFSKALGQNFLVNPSVCPKIAEMGNAKKGFGVIEIGTGIGVLTTELAKRADKVVAIEIDERLIKKMKTKIEYLSDLLEAQEAKIVACDIDLTIYNRKLIIVTDSKETAYFTQKVAELKAIKARAEETIQVIKDMVASEKKEKSDRVIN